MDNPTILSACVFGFANYSRRKPPAERRTITSEYGQNLYNGRRKSNQPYVFPKHKAGLNHSIDHGPNRLKESVYVQETTRFLMNTESSPTPLLKDFFQGTDTTR